MLSFPELLKKIREEGKLTQDQMGKVLGVSTILISMIETGQKEVSKGFVIKLAEKLDVQPGSISPFLFIDKNGKEEKLSSLEKKLVDIGEKLQEKLINVRAKRLKEYV
jgi:transcriptional regulator with XRE-family HTH domain